MAHLAAAVLLLALAASASAACSPAGATYFGGTDSVQTVEFAVLSAYGGYGCYQLASPTDAYNRIKANNYQVVAADWAMTTAQESGLGFSKLTMTQGLQSYSLLYNGAKALTLSCQSLADLYSGFSTFLNQNLNAVATIS
eukprot:SM000129S26125  [mRNA]  locus=s129:127884:128555:+ [translate_table: standard]